MVTFNVDLGSLLFDFRPEYAKYSSDEEEEDDGLLGEPFVKDRELDEQEIDKVSVSFFDHFPWKNYVYTTAKVPLIDFVVVQTNWFVSEMYLAQKAGNVTGRHYVVQRDFYVYTNVVSTNMFCPNSGPKHIYAQEHKFCFKFYSK